MKLSRLAELLAQKYEVGQSGFAPFYQNALDKYAGKIGGDEDFLETEGLTPEQYREQRATVNKNIYEVLDGKNSFFSLIRLVKEEAKGDKMNSHFHQFVSKPNPVAETENPLMKSEVKEINKGHKIAQELNFAITKLYHACGNVFNSGISAENPYPEIVKINPQNIKFWLDKANDIVQNEHEFTAMSDSYFQCTMAERANVHSNRPNRTYSAIYYNPLAIGSHRQDVNETVAKVNTQLFDKTLVTIGNLLAKASVILVKASLQHSHLASGKGYTKQRELSSAPVGDQNMGPRFIDNPDYMSRFKFPFSFQEYKDLLKIEMKAKLGRPTLYELMKEAFYARREDADLVRRAEIMSLVNERVKEIENFEHDTLSDPFQKNKMRLAQELRQKERASQFDKPKQKSRLHEKYLELMKSFDKKESPDFSSILEDKPEHKEFEERARKMLESEDEE